LDLTFDFFVKWASNLIEATGILVIVIGGIHATIRFLTRTENGYHEYRSRLGRAILLGLEFLVAADIIGTVLIEPTIENVIVLGGIVIIRTVLSISLELEAEGRWPWETRSAPK